MTSQQLKGGKNSQFNQAAISGISKWALLCELYIIHTFNSIIYIPVTPSPMTQARKPCNHNSAESVAVRRDPIGSWSTTGMASCGAGTTEWDQSVSMLPWDQSVCGINLRGLDVLFWSGSDRFVMTEHVPETDVPASWKNPTPRLHA